MEQYIIFEDVLPMTNVKDISKLSQAIMSLGCNCQVAYQIRRLKKKRVRTVFDWAFSPSATVLALLTSRFSNLFLKDNLQIVEDGAAVLDHGSGLRFYHIFPRNPEGVITESELQANYDKAHAQLSSCIAAWNQAFLSQRVLCIRLRSAGAPEDAQLLRDAIVQTYKPLEFRLLALNFETSAGEWSRDVSFRDIDYGRDWRGDDPSWEHLACDMES